jgi:hypothetical protein
MIQSDHLFEFETDDFLLSLFIQNTEMSTVIFHENLLHIL